MRATERDSDYAVTALAAEHLSVRGFSRRHDLLPPPLAAEEWRRIALTSAGTALVSWVAGRDVVLLMLGEEVRRWREAECPSTEIQSVVSVCLSGSLSHPRLVCWRDTFEVRTLDEATGYVLLAHGLAKLHPGKPFPEEEGDSHWTSAKQYFAQALRDEAGNAPGHDRPLAAACGGDASLLREMALDRVRQFLTSNREIVERLASALLADTRLTVLDSHDLERLIAGEQREIDPRTPNQTDADVAPGPGTTR